MKILPLLTTIVILSSACKKTKIYSIQGRIVQSSSHPVPVGNYKLSFYQSGSGGAPIPIGAASSSATSTSNSQGYFNCRFAAGEGIFLIFPISNKASLTMQGDKNEPYVNLFWSNIPAKDTVLGNVYLYKEISKAIIKISSAVEIQPSDTLSIEAQTATGPYKKTLTGISLQPNLTITADTISNLISADFNVAKKQYFFDVSCKDITNNRSAINYIYTDPLDESESEFLLLLQ